MILFSYMNHGHTRNLILILTDINVYRKFQNRRANRCSSDIVLYIKACISDGVKIVRMDG